MIVEGVCRDQVNQFELANLLSAVRGVQISCSIAPLGHLRAQAFTFVLGFIWWSASEVGFDKHGFPSEALR